MGVRVEVELPLVMPLVTPLLLPPVLQESFGLLSEDVGLLKLQVGEVKPNVFSARVVPIPEVLLLWLVLAIRSMAAGATEPGVKVGSSSGFFMPGPLKNFHLFLNNGIALVMYASGREANKAQKALNNCLLGNTTIQANMTSEGDANGIIQQLGGGGQQSSRGATPSSVSNMGSSNMGGSSNMASMPKSTSSSDSSMWGNSMGGGPATSIYSGGAGTSIWGAPTVSGSETSQLQPYLPGDLLGESNQI